MTKIMIAQRISSGLEADQIIVMNEGHIAGIGKHQTLIQTCQPYQEIVYSQKDKEDVL